MKLRRLVLGFAVLSASLLFSPPGSEAKGQPLRNSLEVNRVSKHRNVLLRIGKTSTRPDTSAWSKRKPKSLRHLSPKLNACVLPDGAEGLGACVGNCLKSWGVNYTSLIACGAVCAGAATGNPVAIGVCAACLGVGEMIVAGCAAHCLWRSVISPESGPVAKGPRSRELRPSDQARLRERSALPGS